MRPPSLFIVAALSSGCKTDRPPEPSWAERARDLTRADAVWSADLWDFADGDYGGLTTAVADVDGDGVAELYVGLDGDPRVFAPDATLPTADELHDTRIAGQVAAGSALPVALEGGGMAVLELHEGQPGAVHMVHATPAGEPLTWGTISMPSLSPLRGRELFSARLDSGPGVVVLGDVLEPDVNDHFRRTAWALPEAAGDSGTLSEMETGATQLRCVDPRPRHAWWEPPVARVGDFDGDGLTDIVHMVDYLRHDDWAGPWLQYFSGPLDQDRSVEQQDAEGWAFTYLRLGEVADYDGDGLDDQVILTGQYAKRRGFSEVQVNDGPLDDLGDREAWRTLMEVDWEYETAEGAQVNERAWSLVAPDVDGDGQPDLVGVGASATMIWMGPFLSARFFDDADAVMASTCFGARSMVQHGELDGDPGAELVVNIFADQGCGDTQHFGEVGVALFLDPLQVWMQ